MTPMDTILLETYWISQVGLVFAALGAVAIAYSQTQVFSLFELLKYLEQPHIKLARDELYHKLYEIPDNEWWLRDVELEHHATTVCAAFNVVGVLAKRGVRRHFVRHWSHTICWTHESLESYISYRRQNVPNAYDAYSQLYAEAKAHDRRPGVGSDKASPA